mmetsp:Transcript_4461/g.10175  ORF Transcript_4461/g.10175 Transcript_4461/m.10175 type:complete len:81 (+) Transcript_4461:280-522(+)
MNESINHRVAIDETSEQRRRSVLVQCSVPAPGRGCIAHHESTGETTSTMRRKVSVRFTPFDNSNIYTHTQHQDKDQGGTH